MNTLQTAKNPGNVVKAIRVMERVRDRGDSFDMSNWQAFPIKLSEQEKHECKTAACFAGWLAISPEWIAEGGLVRHDGAPARFAEDGSPLLFSDAISQWLGIHNLLGRELMAIDTQIERAPSGELRERSRIYGKLVSDISPQDVIDELKRLLH